MITLHLTRGTAPKGVYLRLPAPPDVENQAFTKLDKISTDVSSTRITDVTCCIENISQYIRCADINTDYEKLKHLANLLNAMTEREQHIFSGALDAESVDGLDDVLRIADSLEKYELIEDVTCDRDLGGWLVEHNILGVDFPQMVRPFLDYTGIGAAYYCSRGGAYTPNGYVKRKDAFVEEQNILRLTLASSTNALLLVLPASEKQLEAAKRALVLEELAQAEIYDFEFAPEYQTTVVIPRDYITVEDANKLALCLQKMSPDEIKTYRAVLEVEEPDAFTEAFHIAMDIDDYELVTDSEGEYGRKALRRMGANDELLEAIDKYTDFDRLGQDMMEEDGVRQTGCGLGRRLSKPFPTEQMIGQTMS